VDGTGAPAFDPARDWHVVHQDAGDVGAADITLARTLSADATTLDLLVRERACASGRSAVGRAALLGLEETEAHVRLRLGVELLEGDQSWPDDPARPCSLLARSRSATRLCLWDPIITDRHRPGRSASVRRVRGAAA
jgi:hypothetical protein